MRSIQAGTKRAASASSPTRAAVMPMLPMRTPMAPTMWGCGRSTQGTGLPGMLEKIGNKCEKEKITITLNQVLNVAFSNFFNLAMVEVHLAIPQITLSVQLTFGVGEAIASSCGLPVLAADVAKFKAFCESV